ncbi:GspH/FimT family protein [Pseudomonas sp. RP23018S]|uniref:GspH/FimT family protein n=1 Tax=Pseudomonas sp. RP23018S TaxID=3096037 RepID=UPI002ACAD63D|nr:GspH/FimT family protein [Pseudomonas sp. RP23018S]MDZ5603276.1 GspH/FimT family protein [Pseudomonas sp. RP23018S]
MKQHGATLIQVLLALALVGVLTQLGVPAYTGIRTDLHLAATARELAQALRYARNQAVLLEQPVQVRAINQDWSHGWHVLGEEQLLREHRPGQPLKIVSNGGSQVTFSALGVPLGRGAALYAATLHVCPQGQAVSAHQVVIASRGRISLRTQAQPEPRCAVTP